MQVFPCKLPVVRESIRIFPDFPKGSLPQVSFDEAVIIQRLAPLDVPDAVDADGINPRPAPLEHRRTAEVAPQAAFILRKVSDVIGDPKDKRGMPGML